MVAEFQHGLIRLSVVLIAMTLILTGLTLAAVWIRLGVARRRRLQESVALGALAAAMVIACLFATPSWDTSENRMNSFPPADEQALRQIRAPLRIEAHLAPEDPRRADLERRALSKLRRLMPDLQVEYISATSTGLFEQTSPHYGEVWYSLGDRKTMTRATTVEAVLETIYTLADVKPVLAGESAEFRGHPLAVQPHGAALVFYFIWPAIVLVIAITHRRKHS